VYFCSCRQMQEYYKSAWIRCSLCATRDVNMSVCTKLFIDTAGRLS